MFLPFNNLVTRSLDLCFPHLVTRPVKIVFFLSVHFGVLPINMLVIHPIIEASFSWFGQSPYISEDRFFQSVNIGVSS